MMLLPLDSPRQCAALFATFAVTGVLGETMFCAAWKMVHGRPFWTYTVAPIFRGCSSWLNFIPWGIGGYIYIFSYQLILRANNIPHKFPIGLIGIVLGIMFLFSFAFVFVRKKNKIRNVHIITVLSVIPLLVIATVDFVMMLFLIFGSVIAGISEYFYGKLLYWIFGKNFWEYHIFPRDDGHLSLFALPGFAVGGLFFLVVYHGFLKFVVAKNFFC